MDCMFSNILRRFKKFFYKGLSIKDVRNQGGRGFVQCGQEGRGVFQMRIADRIFLCKKTSDFSKFMVYPHGQGEYEPVRTRGKGGQFFARDFFRTKSPFDTITYSHHLIQVKFHF